MPVAYFINLCVARKIMLRCQIILDLSARSPRFIYNHVRYDVKYVLEILVLLSSSVPA